MIDINAMNSPEELETEIRRLKEKLKEVQKKNQLYIPPDYINTPEYGWVKKLPCGIGDTVYTIRGIYIRKFYKSKLIRLDTYGWNNFRCHVNGKKREDYEIISIDMSVNKYPLIGNTVFLTEADAEEAITKLISEVLNEAFIN